MHFSCELLQTVETISGFPIAQVVRLRSVEIMGTIQLEISIIHPHLSVKREGSGLGKTILHYLLNPFTKHIITGMIEKFKVELLSSNLPPLLTSK